MKSAEIKNLLFVDLETTGKNGPDAMTDSVIEVAGALVDIHTRETLATFESLIRPHGMQALQYTHEDPIEWDLGDFHLKGKHFADVTQKQWDEAPTIADVLLSLIPMFEGATFAGQNPRFDIRHFRREFELASLNFPAIDYHVIDLCSPAMFLVIDGRIPGISLRHSRVWAGCGGAVQGHRSMSDVQDAIRIFFAMHDYYTKGIEPHAGTV